MIGPYMPENVNFFSGIFDIILIDFNSLLKKSLCSYIFNTTKYKGMNTYRK